ncbi:unnamed protein product [Chrysoparadoxa australica]
MGQIGQGANITTAEGWEKVALEEEERAGSIGEKIEAMMKQLNHVKMDASEANRDATLERGQLLDGLRRLEERAPMLIHEVQHAEEAVKAIGEEILELERHLASKEMRKTLEESSATLTSELDQARGERHRCAGLVDDKKASLRLVGKLMKQSSSVATSAAGASIGTESNDSYTHSSSTKVDGEAVCDMCGQQVTQLQVEKRQAELLTAEAKHLEDLDIARAKLQEAEDKVSVIMQRMECYEKGKHTREELTLKRGEAMQAKHHLEVKQVEVRAAGRRQREFREALEAQEARRMASQEEIQDEVTLLESALRDLRLEQGEALSASSQASQAQSRLLWEEKEQRSKLEDAVHSAACMLEDKAAALARVDSELAELLLDAERTSVNKTISNALSEHMGMRGVQNYVFRDALHQLEANVATYLDQLSDGGLSLSLSMEGDRIAKKIKVRASDGMLAERSLAQLSGGQWRRTSLAVELAFAELTRQRSRFSCNFIVLDEVLR